MYRYTDINVYKLIDRYIYINISIYLVFTRAFRCLSFIHRLCQP